MTTEHNITALLEFESAIIKGAQTQSDSVNSFVANSLRTVIEQVFFQVAPSFLIILSCRRTSPENFFMEMMQRLYTIVDYMIIELVQLNNTKAYTLEHTSYANLVLVDSLEAFLDLNLHIHAANYDTNEYYYIFLQQKDRFIPADMLQIFEYCWQHQFINCNVQIQNAKGEVYMYTYYPFTPGKCEHVESVLIDQFMGTKWKNEIFFPDKLRNFFKCTLTAVVRQVPPFLIIQRDKAGKMQVDGLEGQLIRQLSEHFNFTLKLVEAGVDERTGNWCCGTYAMLQDRSAQIGLGFYRMWASLKDNITTPFPHYQNRLVATIYLGGYNLTTYDIWSFPFETTAWYAIILAFVGLLGIEHLMHRYLMPANTSSRSQTGFYLIAVIFGVTVHRQPTSTARRYLFIFTLTGSFLLRATYSALLYHIFRSHLHKSIPTTIEELFERGFTPVMNQFTYNELLGISYVGDRIKNKKILLNTSSDTTSLTYLEQHYENDLVVFTARDKLLYYVNEENKPGMYYMLPEELTKQQILFWLPKHSYLVDLLTQSMLHLHAVGVMDYWSNMLLSLKFFKSDHLIVDKLLGQAEIYAVYVVIGFLYLLALFIFVLELLSQKYKPIRKLLTCYYD